MELTVSDTDVRTAIDLGERKLRIVARDFHRARSGWSAEINVLMDQTILAYDSFNLAKQDDRTRLAKSAHGHFKNGLGETYDLEQMKHDIDVFCKVAPRRWEESPNVAGQPAVALSPGTVIAPPEYLLKPLIHRGQPTLMYADGGTGKSIFALIVAVIISLGWLPNPLRLMVGKPTRVLYLDWETNRDEIQWRLEAIKEGMNPPSGPDVLYRECRRPFAEDVEPIGRIVRENAIGLVIVDSIGGAVGADLKENEAANLYFSAMRKLGVASLSLTHITKADRGSKDATAFGSRYFHNWARLEWEMKNSQEVATDSINIGLFHRKANNTKLQAPIGLQFHYFNDGDFLKELKVSRIDLTDDPVLAKNLGTAVRITAALRHGAKTPEELIKMLDAKEGTIRSAISRMYHKGEIMKQGAGWGLSEEGNHGLPF